MTLPSSYCETLSRHLFAFLHSPKNEFGPLGRKRFCGFPHADMMTVYRLIHSCLFIPCASQRGGR